MESYTQYIDELYPDIEVPDKKIRQYIRKKPVTEKMLAKIKHAEYVREWRKKRLRTNG